MDLSNAQVVVIGGSSGVGFAAAKRAHGAGAKVLIVGRTPQKLERARSEMSGSRSVVADISNEQSVDGIFEGLERVDHLYISAGTHHHSPVIGSELGYLRRIVDERLWGIVHAVRRAKPLMSGGSITFTTGILSKRPRVGTAIQAAALAAVEALVPALALELAPIRVNCVCLGAIKTPLVEGFYGAGMDDHLKKIAAALPGKKVGTTENVAQAVLMLMANDYINGEILHIDGGGRFASL